MDADNKKEYKRYIELSYFMLILLLSFSLFLFSGCSNTKQVPEQKASHVIRIVTDYREDDLGYQQLFTFAQSLAEISDGALEARLYQSGEWSKAESFIEYLDCESIEMACISISQAIDLQPMYAIYEQPYLFYNLQAVENYVLGNAAQTALNLLPASYHGVGWVANGYNYFVQKQSLQSVSYGTLQHLLQICELSDAMVYDVQAQYSLYPLIASSKWWNTLTELEQAWIQESFEKSLEYILNYQKETLPQQMTEDGIILQSVLPAELSKYTEQWISQREAYFASRSDVLTAYWRPAVMTTIIGKET